CCSGQCLHGVCVRAIECPPNRPTFCDGACVDTSTDPNHCGGCNGVCAAGQVCVNGQCSGCPEGETPCGAACCSASQVCRRSPVTGARFCLNCPQGDVECGGQCVDLQRDRRNCGACGS